MKKEVLVVVDMQNDFINGALGSKEAEAIVDKVVEKIAGFEGEIIATYDTHETNYMDTREGKYLPVPHCIRETEGWKLNPSVEEALDKAGHRAVYKPTFGSVELVDMIKNFLQENNLAETELVITLIGLCTDICVVSNAMLLKANFPEMDIRVDSACCAGVTPEKHEAALETMRSCQIDVF